MYVVKGEHNPAARSERLEKRAHGAMGPEALVLQPALAAAKPLDAGRDRGKLVGLTADQALEAIAAQ
jgi:hypothetical protein